MLERVFCLTVTNYCWGCWPPVVDLQVYITVYRLRDEVMGLHLFAYRILAVYESN